MENKMIVSGQRRVARRYKDDITNLVAIYGDLHAIEGHKIATTLQEFGKVCERDQLKVSAYRGLTSYLKKHYSLDLRITSRKTKEPKKNTQNRQR